MKGILRCLPVILLVLSLSANGIGAAKARPRPALDYHNNVLLITVDTLRADRLGCYGAETVETPNIDLLAAEGVLFSRAFAHNPMTLPSHTNILLGLTPLAHGVHNNIDFVVREEWTTLAEHLKASGYSTAAFIGGFPLDARFGLNQGFEVYDDDFKPNGSSKMAPGERQAAEVVSHAIAWIRKTEGPWFAWIHIYDPHTPYNPPISFKAAYKDRPYDGEVAYVDSALAPLFEVVGHSPTQERTIVVLTADHGESLGEHGEQTHGAFAYNSTLWVPLIIRAPGFKPGVVTENVGHTDIFPSICDLVGLPVPGPVHGISLAPVMDGKILPNRLIYFESLVPYYNFGLSPLRGFYSYTRKFIESPIPEVYDLDTDFEELRNVAEDGSVASSTIELARITSELSQSGSARAADRASPQTLKMMQSLGYLAGGSPPKEVFGPKDDVKIAYPVIDKAEKLFGLPDTEAAIRGLKELAAQDTAVYQPCAFLARLLKKTGRHDEALKLLREGLKKHPDSYEIFFLACESLFEAGRYDQLLETMKGRNYLRLSADPDIWKYKGQALMAKGDFRGAVEALEMAATIDDGYAEVFESLGRAYFSLFLKSREGSCYASALSNLNKAVQLDPDSAEAHNSLGTVFLSGHNYDGAIRSFERVLQLTSSIKKARFYLGYAYLNKGQWEKARTELVTYKNMYYSRLTPEEKAALDGMITATYTRHIR